MKIFVTGGAGYIGSVTAEILLAAGHAVFVFDNLERGHRAALPSGACFYEGDLREAGAIDAAMREVAPDGVIHFAAYALVGESMQRPDFYFANNVAGAINLAEAMRKNGVQRLVFSSTCATYGAPERMPITEETPQRPTNPYGESKLMCERIFQWYAGVYQWRTVFLRYFNACGATARLGEDHDPETHLIPNILKVALGQVPHLRVFGDDYPTPDGTCIRDYIHVLDLADAHLRALTQEVSGAFNLGTGTGCSVNEVLEAARRITGHPIPARYEPRRRGDPPCLVADYTRARRQLGWEPQHSRLEQIIQSAWDWHRAHPRGYQSA